MTFERKVYRKLLAWKNESKGSKALLIEGARRIGKSTICAEFGKNEYRSCLIVDFSRATEEVTGYFSLYRNDLDTLFMLLSTTFGVDLYERESLIIFDEVQLCPKAREAIKFLVEDGRYDYLETGSLISIRENVKDILLPSEERSIRMYPMDFEEFCAALGEKQLLKYIRHCFDERLELSRDLHTKAMLLFGQYMLVGGMPKAVSEYLEKGRSFEAADREKRDILKLYRNDIMKINSRYRAKVLAVFDQIPGLLSKHEKRVVFNQLATGSNFEQYEDSFFWLGDSMIVNEAFSCSDPNVGLSLNEDRTHIKCYMGDTGLLLSHAFDENDILSESVYHRLLSGDLGINNGMLYENAIAQMLSANDHRLFFYTRYNRDKHRNDIEIDFLLSNESKLKYKVFPIEVKSGKRYKTTSLDRFQESFKSRMGGAYIIHPKNLSIREDGVVCIPPYMAWLL